MPTMEERYASFEKLGEDAVRELVAMGKYSERNKAAAQLWLDRLEQSRADEKFRLSAQTQVEQQEAAVRASKAAVRAAEAAERAADAAERQATTADRASRIAMAALIVAIIASILTLMQMAAPK